MFKKFFSAAFLHSFLAVAFLVAGSTLSHATGGLDLSTVTIDTAPIFQLAGIIVAAIASIWAIKKVIKLGNHS